MNPTSCNFDDAGEKWFNFQELIHIFTVSATKNLMVFNNKDNLKILYQLSFFLIINTLLLFTVHKKYFWVSLQKYIQLLGLWLEYLIFFWTKS